MEPYNVVHVATSGEFLTPLVASQVFDHAEAQATLGDADQPLSVSAWLFEPMRRHLEFPTRRKLRELRRRCPHVDVRLVAGIGRWNNWPAVATARWLRRRLGLARVVYHCRGEFSAEWALEVRRSFPSDAVVLDVRGAWPYEVLLAKGVTRVEDARGETRTAFEAALAKLRHCIELADGVTTVSENLKKWLVEAANAPAETTVIPCCVSSTVDDRNRDVIRRSWGITNEKVYVYLGTTVSRSQGLEDLVMPFLRASQIVSADVRALLLTPDLDAMRGLAHRAGLDPERTMIMHVPQADVRHVLTAADVGLLLRPAIFMNRWSQPTKLGEYLASGLPVIVEEGTGDVPTMLAASEAGLTVHLGASGVSIAEEAQRAYVWVRESGGAARQRARQLAERDFLWRSVSPTIRKLYRQSLQRRSAVSDRSEASPVSIGSPSESPRTLLRAADR